MGLIRVPRSAKNSNRTGSYELSNRILTPVINPGDEIIVEQFFTGYGEIDGVKVVFYPSGDLFDGESYFLGDLYEKEKDIYCFGGKKHPIGDGGCTIILGGTGIPFSDGTSSLFVDNGTTNPPQILTEARQIEAPLKYVLRSKKDIRPGAYFLEFTFTYFNGDAWKSSNKKVEFKVQNFFQRHDVLLGSFALLATFASFLRSCAPMFDNILSVFGYKLGL